MRILYGYSNCSEEKYKEIFGERQVSALQADQKYHGLLIRGLAGAGAEVYACSGLPINRTVMSRLWIHEKEETRGAAHYHYYRTVNLPGVRQLMVFFGGFWQVLRTDKNDTCLLCDYQNAANAYGMLLAAKLRHIPSTVIVMDLPDFITQSARRQSIYSRLFRLADSFILLTEQMKEKVNPNHKPYIVVEGIADPAPLSVSPEERYEAVCGKQIVIYAGSIQKLYGIQNLAEGFLQAGLPNAELWIYGDGDYRTELEALCREHPSVKYKGIRPNEEIVREEQKAALLVNPRPTAPEYTKYSFPSKNMEYMASGTPLLTTDLPGMPREYLPYVYLLDKERESARGIAETMKAILSENAEARYAKGSAARQYVLEHKSNIAQAQRIISFLRGQAFEDPHPKR